MLRFVEVCVVLVLVSRLSLHLPVAVKNSSEYFRDLTVFINSPRFVFLIGNVIIITLFAQSGQFSAQGSRRNGSEHDLYQEFLQNSTTNNQITQGNQKHKEKQNIETEDSTENQQVDGEKIKYPEKKGIRTKDSIKNRRINGNMTKNKENKRIYERKEANFGIRNKGIDTGKSKWTEKQRMKTGEANNGLEVKDYRRCQTEILCRVNSEKQPRGVLRRCETENRIKGIQDARNEEEEEVSYPEDNMSNEEFRRTVEEFIARQQRLRREEDYFLA